MFQLTPLNRNLSSALRDAMHPKEKVRLSAIDDLAKLGVDEEGSEARGALERVLREDASVEARAHAALALADSASRRSVPLLLDALGDEAPRVRQMALLALGELAEPSDGAVISALKAALTESAPALRFQALTALVNLGVDADPELERALSDSDVMVRSLALRLIDERSDTQGSLPQPLKQQVGASLDDENPGVRLAAAIVLTRHGATPAASVLCDLLNGPSEGFDPEDEQAAIELVRERKLRGAIAGLQRRARRGWFTGFSPFAWQARAALAVLGDGGAKKAILRGLAAWSWDARTVAVVAAGRARLKEAEAVLLAMRGKPSSADPLAVEDALRSLDGAA
jgi:HEAT repeat protein